ncbi:major facilitator superfamily MFS-1 (plasmid) [Azospirillum sp. B510]|uniref:MFS transporter n=1 Tax=Azospirillum sp. (strain B510) TaxID=137722 RepID=UPI0001C4BBE4|nr:MFS transporter [Azospirillum sp. B510]BAI74430.1 major facilitator superfamily MFS-1 [Azospirillum sp. B510]
MTESSHSTPLPQQPRRATARQGAVILLGSSLTIVGAVMVAPVLPKIGAEFGPVTPQADALVPLVVAGPALAIALFAPVAGWLADHVGRKSMLMLGTLLYALFGALPSQLDDLSLILLSRLVFGCAEAMVMTCCTTLVGDYWSGTERSRYIGRQVVTIGVVGSLFFVIGGAAGESSWRAPFLLYLLPLLLLPAMALVLWEPVRASRSHRPKMAFDRESRRMMVVACTLVFVGMLGANVVPVQTPGIVVALGITSSTLIGLAAGLGLLASLLGSILWPPLRRLIGTRMVNALLLALMAVGLWILVHGQSYELVLVAVVIGGTGVGLLVPNALAPLLEHLPEVARARGVGGFTSCLYLGQFGSPLVIAAIAGPAQGVPAAISIFSLALLAVAAVWFVVGLRRGVPAGEAGPA